MKNRFLALLLALCLLAGIPAGALAEDIEISAEAVEDAAQEAESVELGGEEALPEPEPEAVPEPEIAAPETLADLPEFTEGYAAVVAAENLLYDDAFTVAAENLPVGTVLCVVARGEGGEAQVACGMGGEIALLWTDAVSLRPMEADEVSAYIAAAEDDGFLWLDENRPVGVIIPEEKAALALNAGEIALDVGESFALSADADVTWSVEDADVAVVDEDGAVTAVGAGETRVVATAEDGRTAACAVRVGALAKGTHFAVSELVLGVGEKTSLLSRVFDDLESTVPGKITYQTSNKKYVSVSSAGVVKGVKKGSAIISAVTADGQQAVCEVTVLKAPSKVAVDPAKVTLGVGMSCELEYAIPAGTAGTVTWSSKKPSIASVDPVTGVMAANAPGTVEVYAKAFNGKKGTVKVTVQKAPTMLTFGGEAVAIGVGQKLSAAMDAGSFGSIEYEIEDPTVLGLQDGQLVGLKEGVTQVTAATYNGLTAACEVSVNPAPPYVKLPWTKLILGVNETLQLEPDAAGCTDQFAYTSSKTKYVTVDAGGLVKGKKAGKSVITVSAYNGRSASVEIEVLKAPTSITLSTKSCNMGVGDSFILGYTLSKKTGGSVTFTSSDPSILEVDDTGLVTAMGAGVASVTVRTYNNKSATCQVTVYKAPTDIWLDNSLIELWAGQTYPLEYTLSEGSWSDVTYVSADPAVAKVSADGVVTGVGFGNTTISVQTSVPEVFTTAYVSVWDAPSSLSLEKTNLTLNVDETYTIQPIIPANSRTEFTFSSSNPKVAVVSEEGVVHTLNRGKTVITVSTHNNKKAVLNLTVQDPWYPEGLVLMNEPEMMKTGDTFQLEYTVIPASAIPNLMWSSSDASVATVDDNGLITAKGMGYAVISAVSLKNEALGFEVLVAVETDGLTMVIPARTTNESGIKANLAKIDAVRRSAIIEIDRLASKKIISSSDASKRRSMVNNIFANYAFPWKTLSLQKYWKAANSEGGVKDFKTDRVYYGMPYISGSGDNRHYDVALALKENRYYDSGKGYYILNQSRLLSGKYVGNDCSGLVNVSIWGTDSKRASDRTDDIASSKYYKTISDWTAMRPGDLICKSSAHVVMFLYYVNAAKTKFMMIENGGAEAGTNTVHCDIYDASYYQGNKYRIRRLATLD